MMSVFMLHSRFSFASKKSVTISQMPHGHTAEVTCLSGPHYASRADRPYGLSVIRAISRLPAEQRKLVMEAIRTTA